MTQNEELNYLSNKVYDFIKSEEKINNLIKANKTLNILNSNNKIIFVYSAPKVGSTSIVSSLRIFSNNTYNIIHVHDEEMLNVLGNIKNVSVNEIILYNKYLGKDVYVINIFRSPIERKISAFFEKIGSYHFNNLDENVNKYNINRVIDRFNNIFPWLALGDHFLDVYNINNIPLKFDNNKCFLLVKENGISYITLRLKDVTKWNNILQQIFGFEIVIIKDYESRNKPIKEMFTTFKKNYRIPINLLNDLMKDKHFNFYYSSKELEEYFNEWKNKSAVEYEAYTYDEYKLYTKITLENSHLDKIQTEHYFDEGCFCRVCTNKRKIVIRNIKRGMAHDKLIHDRITHHQPNKNIFNKQMMLNDKINNTYNKNNTYSNGNKLKQHLFNFISNRK